LLLGCAAGIGPGDVVTIQIPNWVEYPCVFFALERLGAATGKMQVPTPKGSGRALKINHVLPMTVTFPGPGQYSIEILVNGEPVDPTGDQLDFASIEPIKATLVIDGQGKVLDAEAGGLDLSQMLGDLGALQDLAGGNLGQHLGPPFPGRSLSLGETWTDEQTVEALEQTVTTKASYTVTGREEIDGHEVFVIESHATTSAFTLDLGQFLASLFGGFAGTAEDQASQAELEAMLAQLEFRISVDDVNVTGTTWFDPVAGLVRKAEQASDLAMTMDMAVPDEASAELMEMTMVMEMAQRMSAALDTDSA